MKIKIDYKKTKSLVPYAMNARTHSEHQVQQIAKSIQEFGFNNPVLIDADGSIIAGHGRVMAANLLKMADVPCVVLGHLSERQRRAYILADNKIALNSGWDMQKLADEVSALAESGFDVELTGFDEQEIDALLREEFDALPADSAPLGGAKMEPDEDSSSRADLRGEYMTKYQVQLGQIWELGDHRVVCGDSTVIETYNKLLGGMERVNLVFTDPPYGVSYKDREGRGIEADDLTRDNLSQFLLDCFKCMVLSAKNNAAFYIWHASSTCKDFEHAMMAAGLVEKQYLVWVKDSFVLGWSDYRWQTEPCFYAEKDGHKAEFYGPRNSSNVWKLGRVNADNTSINIGSGLLVTDGSGNQVYIQSKPPKNKKTRHVRVQPGDTIAMTNAELSDCWHVTRDPHGEYLHPTQKPVELAIKAIENSTKPGELVLDSFGGSGSTLMACEITGRKARVIEIDPEFVAVHLYRWEKHTGQTPKLIGR